MQTSDSQQEKVKPAIPETTEKKPLRTLNIGLALAGALLYLVLVTNGWEIYNNLPGGRTLLLVLAGLLFFGLLATRLYLAYGREKWLAQLRHNQLTGRVILVTLVLILAFGLRLWDVKSGPVTDRERTAGERALYIVQTGNFDPIGFATEKKLTPFTRPDLYPYLLTGAYSAHFLQGVSASLYDGTKALEDQKVREDFYRWGRWFTALLGTGAVALVFAVGALWYGWQTGLVAAFLLAVSYPHIIYSREMEPGIPAGLVALLPFLFLQKILAGKANRWTYLLGGATCGFAVGTVYSNILLVISLGLALIWGRKWKAAGLVLAGLVAGYFLAAPFTFWHLPQFLEGLTTLATRYNSGQSYWLDYLKGLGSNSWPVLLLALAGIVLAFLRHEKRDVLLLAFPLVYFGILVFYKGDFTRDALVLFPFLALAGGAVVVEAVGKFLKKWQGLALAIICLLVALNPLIALLTGARG